MTDGDGATIDVDLFGIKTQELDVGEGNDGEGLVDLVKVNVLVGQAGVLDSLGDGQGRRNGEALGLPLGVAPSENLGNGLNTEFLDLGLGHEDDGSGTVIDGGGVGSGDGAVRLERRAHGLELVDIQVLDFVVALNLDGGLASATADLNRDNLLEQTGLGGGLCLLVGLDGVLVLSLARELALGGT